jgi:hypothetical protein
MSLSIALGLYFDTDLRCKRKISWAMDLHSSDKKSTLLLVVYHPAVSAMVAFPVELPVALLVTADGSFDDGMGSLITTQVSL